MAAVMRLKKQQVSNFLWGWVFILPTFLGIVVLNIYPLIRTIWQSFHRVGHFGRGNEFVGLENWQTMINDPAVLQSLWNTLLYTVIEVPFSIAIGFIFAVILNQKIRGRSFFRTVFFLPMIVAPAAVAMVWNFLLNTTFGLVNIILTSIGLNAIPFLTDMNLAIYSLAMVGVWSGFGYVVILFLAGLQNIPQEMYESAEIDGASFIRKQLSITIPLISPTTFFILILRVIWAMQVFDLIFLMIGRHGLTLPRTQSLVFLFYRYSFMELNRGLGAAIVLFLLAVIMIFTFIQNYVSKRWVHYE